MLVAALVALAAPDAGAALKKAKDLGPTPVENDCLIYRGKNPCYYGLWSGRFVVDRHILNIGDVLSATIQTYGGFAPVYSWVPEPGLPYLKRIACPIAAPKGPADGSPNYFTLNCAFRAKKKTPTWQVFGPSMGLAISSYVDGDYYAVVAGASVSGRVLDGEGKAVPGVRVTITGPEDVYAVTDAAGFYDAIELTPGNYTISIGKAKLCHDTGTAISKASCRKSVKKHLGGTAEVNWRGLGKYAIHGRVRDEWGRGLAGVKIKATGLPGGESLDVLTNKDGSYRIGFEGAATVEVAAEKGGLPNAFYYVVKPDGNPSTGQAADVTPNAKEPQVKVDWELDRRLYFSLPNAARTARAPANGFSKYAWIGQVLTQHGDPAPNVPIQIDPLSSNPPGAICTTQDQLLSPTLFADGKVDNIGGFEQTTDARGRLPLQVFPGTKGGFFNFDLSRKSDLTQTARGGVTFDFAAGTPIASGNQLVTMLASGGNKGLGLRPSPEQIVEWFAGSRMNPGFQAVGIDLMIVQAGGSRAVAFFPRDQGPTVTSAGGVVGGASAYVLDPGAFVNILGLTTMPTLSEWAAGQAVTISRPDARTYAGYPIPARAGHAFGSCLDSATGGTSTYSVHSPVNLLLRDAAGKQLGIAADGTAKAEFEGIVYRNGESVTIVVPSGAYKASLVGTGSGSVTIASDTPAGTSALRFSSKKGAKTTTSIAGGAGLGKITFAGSKISPIRGIPLAIKGLPKTWRAYEPTEIVGGAVVDPNGTPLIGASVTVPAGGELFRLTTDTTGGLSGFWPVLTKGRHVLTVSAPGFATTKVPITVKRARR